VGDGRWFSYKSAEMSPKDAGAKQEIPAKYSDMNATELKATVPAGGGTIDFELKPRVSRHMGHNSVEGRAAQPLTKL
jgi:hypothetical protein